AWRGLTMAGARPAAARAAAAGNSSPPVASRTTPAGACGKRRATSAAWPSGSLATANASPPGHRWTSRRALETSMPTKVAVTAEDLRGGRLGQPGLAMRGDAPATVRAWANGGAAAEAPGRARGPRGARPAAPPRRPTIHTLFEATETYKGRQSVARGVSPWGDCAMK